MPSMTLRMRIATGLAAAHLLLVGLSAAHVDVAPGDGAWSRLVNAYGFATGADNSFGFFAPRVASEVNPTLVLADGNGRTRDLDLLAGLNHEVRNRVTTIYGIYAQENQPLRRQITRSWSAYALSRHPWTERVTIKVAVRIVPTMAEYRAGQRARWREVYRVITRRKGD